MTDKFYKTFFDKNFIEYEPTQYSNDVFSVSFNFRFINEEKIFPYFTYKINKKKIKTPIRSYLPKIGEFINITFSSFQTMTQNVRPISAYLFIKTENKKIIFCKKHKILKFSDYSYIKTNLINTIDLNLMVASCFSLPGYREPVEVEIYDKFTEVAKLENADMIIGAGDLVYLEPLNITSESAVQEAYTQLRTFDKLKGSFSNHTWLCCNEDHDYSYNNGCKNTYIIDVLKNNFTNNFPIISQVSKNFRANIRSIKNITFITLDTISCRIYNPNYDGIGYDKYIAILGEEQINFLLDALTNVDQNFSKIDLCFIIVGKSMFGNMGDTFLYCVREREIIFNHIKILGLKNVCFICGDSHFSDVSQYEVRNSDSIFIREIRCSSIGSKPRKADENEWRVEGSIVERNNFGRININGTFDNYEISYFDYTLDGVVFNYNWNMNY